MNYTSQIGKLVSQEDRGLFAQLDFWSTRLLKQNKPRVCIHSGLAFKVVFHCGLHSRQDLPK